MAEQSKRRGHRIPGTNRRASKGDVFNMLTFVDYVGPNTGKGIFLCECGSEHVARIVDVMRGYTTSCGCRGRRAIGTRSFVDGQHEKNKQIIAVLRVAN